MQVNDTQFVIIGQSFDCRTYLFFDNAWTDGILFGKKTTYRSEQDYLWMLIQRTIGINKCLICIHKMLLAFPVLGFGIIGSQFNQNNIWKKFF